MNSIGIAVMLLVALFAILFAYRLHKLKPEIARIESQRMCPSCGLITSRLRANCRECGKPL